MRTGGRDTGWDISPHTPSSRNMSGARPWLGRLWRRRYRCLLPLWSLRTVREKRVRRWWERKQLRLTCSHVAAFCRVTGICLTVPRPRASLFLWAENNLSSFFSSSLRLLQYLHHHQRSDQSSQLINISLT